MSKRWKTTQAADGRTASASRTWLVWTLGLFAGLATPAYAQMVLPSCRAICEMETQCKTIVGIPEIDREPFCLESCTAPLFDPSFHDCLTHATDCEAFSACVQAFTREQPLALDAPLPLSLAVDGALPKVPCQGVFDGCTYPDVCCTQLYSGARRPLRVHVCGQRHCPGYCLGGLNPFCPHCGCPTTHETYPGWPPPSAEGQGLAAFGNRLVLGYEGDDLLKRIFVTSSLNGRSFANTTAIPRQNSDRGPGLAAFQDQLVLAYKAADDSNNIYVTFSKDGINFTDPVKIPDAQTPAPPAIAVYAGELRVAYTANDTSHSLWTTSSPDGRVWTPPQKVPDQQSPSKPALAAFGGQLFMAYRPTDPANQLRVTRTTDLVSWTIEVLEQQRSDRAPALAVFDDRLFMAYKANDASNDLFVTSSSDGVHFDQINPVTDQQTPEPPTLASFNDELYLAYRANDSSNTLWITWTKDGKTWLGAAPLTGQTSP